MLMKHECIDGASKTRTIVALNQNLKLGKDCDIARNDCDDVPAICVTIKTAEQQSKTVSDDHKLARQIA